MEYMTFSFINLSGLNLHLIYFLLVMPVIVMIGAFLKLFLGIRIMSLNVLLTLTYALAFLVPDNTLASVVLGSVITIFVYFFSYYIKRLTINAVVHHLSRIAFVIATISIIVLATLSSFVYFTDLERIVNVIEINPFGLIMLVILSEFFSANQVQKGIKTSRTLFINTLAVSIGTSLLISFSMFEAFLLQYPIIVLFIIVSLFFIGQYSGMRVSEFIRFLPIAMNKDSVNKND